jgi:TolA-binding protein
MSAICERWVMLADRQAVGEALARDEEQFLAEHAQVCRHCGAEDALWRQAGRLLDAEPAGADDGRRDQALAGAVVERLRAERPAGVIELAARRRRRTTAAVVAALAAAAALALVLRTRPGDHVARSRVEIERVSGVAEIAGATARPGMELAEGQALVVRSGSACVTLSHGVRACADARSELRVASALDADRRLHLAQGRVVARLDKQPAGMSFSVATRDGVVTAVGTVFAVEVDAAGPSRARVLQGVVAVRDARGERRELGAHQSLVIGETRPRALAPAEEQSDLALVDGTTAAAAAKDADVVSIESLPLDRPGDATAGETPSAAELLRRAQELRQNARWSDAAAAYRRLQAAHPRSAEARAVHVSLGELLLTRLGDPSGALRAFEAYGGGPLAQEARWGRIRALRALGRAAEAERAAEDFVRAYPDSPAAKTLKK